MPWHLPTMTVTRIAADAIANRNVAQITMIDATTLDRVLNLVDLLIRVATRNHNPADVTTPARHVVTPIAGRIAPDLKLVDRTIDAVTRSHRKVDATTPVRRVATQIEGRIALVLNLM